MTSEKEDEDPPNSVTIVQEGEKWIVIVRENGEQHKKDFLSEAHAENYALGQRIRLHLPRETDE